MNRIIIIAIVCFLTISCKTKKEVIATKPEAKDVQSGLCADTDNELSWNEYIQDTEDDKDTDIEFHRLMSINNRYLNEVMMKKFVDGGGVMSFPLLIDGNLECKKFELENSNTISREKQKEIGLFSFKGIDLDKTSNTVRVDFNIDSGLKVYAFIDGGSFLLKPIRKNGKTIYITYDKTNTEEIKRKFELNE